MHVLPPAWFLMAIGVMGVLHWLAPVARLVRPPWNLLGLAGLAAGIVVAAAGNLAFRRHGTPVHPYAEAATLVVDGPFRYTRNPMYLGLALVLAGIAVLLGTLTPIPVVAAFVLVMWRLFIRREERALEERFGQAYASYRRRVRRWL